MNKSLALVLAAGLVVAFPSFVSAQHAASPATPAAQPATKPSGKTPVHTEADLPVHEYTIEGKASEFLVSDAPFRAFVTKVKADTQSDLDKYDIQDKTTLQTYTQRLVSIALFEQHLDEVPALVERVRDLEGKESKRLMTGAVALSYISAKKSAGTDKAAFEAAFRKDLKARVENLPWDKVSDEIKQARGRAQFLTRDLVMGQMAAGLDPVVEQTNGKLSSELANQLVGVRASLDVMLPLQPMVADVYGALIDSHAKTAQRVDTWTPNQVTITKAEGLAPVTICVWDSGVDMSVLGDRVWTNSKEKVNGKDDDGNGFVDDVHGIAFDLFDKPTVDLLHPITDLTSDRAVVEGHMKGFMDLQSSIDSPEASAVRTYLSSLKKDQVKPFMEDLSLYGNFSHGTHVAGIASNGNDMAHILAVRITFDYRTIPQVTPSVEQAKGTAKAYHDAVAYMKANGVRVVNMSWGGSMKDVEVQLEQKGAGGTTEQRAALAREIFTIMKDGLKSAMESAPEILFVAAAGNSDNDNQFAEFIPSGLSLANMVTVGAIDETGKPTSFTTFGKNVTLYADGFEVESYVPGGKRLKFSGTSMAAPQMTNLVGKLLAVNPSLTPAQLIDLLKKGADPMPGYEGRFIINPKKTLPFAKR